MWSVPRGSNYGSGSFQDNASTSVSYIQMCMNENMNTVNAEFEIQNPSLTTYKKSVRGWAVDVGSEWNNGVIGYFYGIDNTSNGKAITGIRILTSNNNTLDAGIIKVYGYK